MIKSLMNEKRILRDYLLWAAFCFVCFIGFCHADIYHTGMSSLSYLEGHILDFYDYNQTIFSYNSYMPTMYVLFALWNIPIRVLGLVNSSMGMAVPTVAIIWFKLFTSMLYVGTAMIIYHIGKLLGWNEKTALIATFVFVSNPIGIFSQFIFSQYDIITAFFMTLGIYYYLKGNKNRFIVAFAIASSCKYIAILFFVPLLLYKNKEVVTIIIDILKVASLFLAECIIYIHSAAFRQGVFGFGPAAYVFQNSFDLGHVKVSIVILSWLAVCAYAFFCERKEISDEIFILNIVTFICFGLSFWHPQWLLIAVPIWSIGTVFSKRVDIFLWLDILMYTFFLIFVVNFWKHNVDEAMFGSGVLRRWLSIPDEKLMLVLEYPSLSDVYLLKDINILFSCFVGVLFVYTAFKAPKYLNNCEDVKIEKVTALMRARYIYGICLFVIPAFICCYICYTR